MAERITDKLVKALEPPETGNRITYDSEVKGFGVRVTAAGAKAFILNYRVAGRERRLTIGSYPDWSAAAAREEAKDLKRRVDQGQDPLSKRIEERTAPTVNDLWKAYEEHHLPNKRPRSAADDRSMWQTYILPRLGSEKVADITAQDVDALHAWISQTKPVRANRVIEVLKTAMFLAIRWKWRSDNPVSGVRRNHEDKRERYLSPKEMVALSEALEAHSEKASCDAIRLMLLTGARKTEVLAAKWSMFDLDEGVWVKPSAHTKQKKTHRVPLSSAAVELLRRIKAEGADPVFVFPGRVAGKPLGDIKRTWAVLCAKAELKNVRIHDLRHTFASVLASNNLGLPIIGALLGHTQAQTTQRYAHLFDDPLRAAAEAAATVVNGNHLRKK
ncbi:integrase (plasmid) [Azospirillum baldaniorum]|uniref:Phage integrase n=2 Tax=Azospirillum TaxID=191 RepID=A0A9P1K0G7_9PROT|nr:MULTISPECIES: site-specific integrase [Azospirillum]AWJ94826.1 integrase [Azospirillum baldaniorum]MDQ2104439.1 tyrosine-type recombinase/integrase [Azospirillum isscasi]TWA69807.1 site-specific recombinase XerD [Azospirillum brasilense]CCD03249.1 phage integrase [Azospirillum baldaniorum]